MGERESRVYKPFLPPSVITTDSIYQLKASLLLLNYFLGYFPNFQSSSSVSVLAHFPRYSGTTERLIVLGRHVWPTTSPSHGFLLFMVFGYLPPSLLQWLSWSVAFWADIYQDGIEPTYILGSVLALGINDHGSHHYLSACHEVPVI